MNNNELILKTLESVLGHSKKTSKGNYAFNCPSCYKNNHKPKKLEINLNTHQYQCWICGSEQGGIKGKKLDFLFKKIEAPLSKIQELKSFLSYCTTYKTDKIEGLKEVELPKEYKPLFNISQKDLTARQALSYLKSRNLSLVDILKYQIGYCESGRYANKIIIPNYSATGKLNYFIARSFEEDPINRFSAPSVDKNSIIGFENLINWDLPIILCEGPFDAIAIKRNAVPLYGKTLSKELTKKLLSNEVKNIYLALDSDALKSTLKIAGDILHSGKKLYVIKLDGKDPSDMGFEHFTELVQQSQEFTFSDLFSLKLAIN
jgi:hypothetical protein